MTDDLSGDIISKKLYLLALLIVVFVTNLFYEHAKKYFTNIKNLLFIHLS